MSQLRETEGCETAKPLIPAHVGAGGLPASVVERTEVSGFTHLVGRTSGHHTPISSCPHVKHPFAGKLSVAGTAWSTTKPWDLVYFCHAQGRIPPQIQLANALRPKCGTPLFSGRRFKTSVHLSGSWVHTPGGSGEVHAKWRVCPESCRVYIWERRGLNDRFIGKTGAVGQTK